MKRGRLALMAVLMLFVACGESNPNQECLEALNNRQARAADRAAQELDRIGDAIEGALDIQQKDWPDRGQERILRNAQARARTAQRDLESSFSVVCE